MASQTATLQTCCIVRQTIACGTIEGMLPLSRWNDNLYDLSHFDVEIKLIIHSSSDEKSSPAWLMVVGTSTVTAVSAPHTLVRVARRKPPQKKPAVVGVSADITHDDMALLDMLDDISSVGKSSRPRAMMHHLLVSIISSLRFDVEYLTPGSRSYTSSCLPTRIAIL